jgi:hypothetical protein
MTADGVMRATVADMPLPALPAPAFTTPVKQSMARIGAIWWPVNLKDHQLSS